MGCFHSLLSVAYVISTANSYLYSEILDHSHFLLPPCQMIQILKVGLNRLYYVQCNFLCIAYGWCYLKNCCFFLSSLSVFIIPVLLLMCIRLFMKIVFLDNWKCMQLFTYSICFGLCVAWHQHQTGVFPTVRNSWHLFTLYSYCHLTHFNTAWMSCWSRGDIRSGTRNRTNEDHEKEALPIPRHNHINLLLC